ncbi:MAG: recombinase family protein [Oscillospiraceae bacterium]|jgi:site-specific DNA recombinase|nr:recombinase family protein [Oscillospiraceae bacterium]
MSTGIYVRVSTEEQAKEGYSIRGQQQKLEDYARIKDWPIHDVYTDEGISGKNITERPEIKHLIDDVQAGHVKNVLVFKIDRLTRSTADLIYLVDLFNAHGCAFNSLMESIDTHTASGRMFLKIIGIFAEFERENIAERIILGRERKVKEGYTLCSHTASYGYDRPKGQKIQTINADEAQVVREIFELYANQGLSITEIARRLNLRGVPTKHNNKWTTQGVRNMLKNSNYMGHVRHHYENAQRAYTVQGQHEQIISQALFDKAQHRLTKNPSISPRKQPREENYFTGFLVCANCGHKLHAHNIYSKLADGTTKFRGYYGCGNTVVGACNASEMSALKLERAFSEHLTRFADFEGNAAVEQDAQAQTQQESRQQIAICEEKLRQMQAKAREALDCYANSIFSVEEYCQVKKRMNSDQEMLCAELQRLRVRAEEMPHHKLEIAKSLQENWDGLSYIEKRMFLMQFVEKIVVENEKTGTGLHDKQVRIFEVAFGGAK